MTRRPISFASAFLLSGSLGLVSPGVIGRARAETAPGKAEIRDPTEFAPLSGPVGGDEATGFVSRGLGAIGLLSERTDAGLAGGGALHVRGTALLFGPIATARYLERHFIGWDSSGGATYSLSAQGGVGLRWALEGNHGPFARLDIRAEMQRLGGLY